MYVYSSSQAMKTIALPAVETAVSSYVNGSLIYLAGPSGVTMRNACDTTYGQATAFSGGHPTLFRAIADGVRAIGVESPGIDVFDVQVQAPRSRDVDQSIDCDLPLHGHSNGVDLRQPRTRHLHTAETIDRTWTTRVPTFSPATWEAFSWLIWE